MGSSDRIEQAMHQAVADGVFPGAVLMVRVGGHVACQVAVGLATRLPSLEPASLDTIYDLASLTKPLATGSAVLCLIQEGSVALSDRLDRVLSELEGAAVGAATIFHLLNHSSGLPAWRPFYQEMAPAGSEHPGLMSSEAAKRAVLSMIAGEALVFPTGTGSLYSDLGFILLGLIVERVGGQPLTEFCRQRLYVPMNAAPLGFLTIDQAGGEVPGGARMDRALIASTEDDPWRGRLLRGEVHDENAFALGGAAGHAGLFGTAAAVFAVSKAWLDGYWGRRGVFGQALVQQFVTRQAQTPGSSWGLGWDTPSAPSSSGSRFSGESFGHLGYTGTSLWVDPTKELEVVLLSNRVHPVRTNNRIQEFRPFIHDLVYEECTGI
jgi:CubicO group peptidase (beta-lactamase class C family)